MPDLKLILTIHCEHAARLQSESMERPLSRSEYIAMRIHTLICRSCRRFRKQTRLLSRLLTSMPEAWRQRCLDDGVQLSPQRRRQIHDLLVAAQRDASDH